MITPITDVPANMVAFRASADVSQDDFSQTVIPQVEALLDKQKDLNYLLVLDTELKNFSAGAWLQDAWLGLKAFTHWNRAAIVSDTEGIRTFTNIFSKLMPGTFKGFPHEALQKAINWVSTGE